MTTDDAGAPTGVQQFLAARDLLFDCRGDYARAYAEFRWPEPEQFNWALDYFDGVLAVERGDQQGLRLIEDDGSVAGYTFAELSRRSSQLAAWLRARGVSRGMRVLLVLGNQVELWESMLACIKLGAVIIPATTLLSRADLADRLERGAVGAVIARSDLTGSFGAPGDWLPVAVGESTAGLARLSRFHSTTMGNSRSSAPTAGSDPLLLYFTSGTTSQPKLVEHTHLSYPVGHLSTMYWIGLQPGDVHLNVSSPGLGQTRLVLLLRALERRRHRGPVQLRPLRRRPDAGRAGRAAGHDVLRAADRVADAGATGSDQVAAAAARARRRR